jgi:tetraacyldisaccharide 4'-kinase
MTLFRPSDFREIVSGRRRGIAAAVLRAGLRIAESPYSVVVQWRNSRYDSGRAAIYQMPVLVVSVGNLSLGGTGKTPMVEWLADWFGRRQVRVTLISRGYGAKQGQENDEAVELRQKLPEVPHLQNPDRVAAARQAVEQTGCQVILLDDAFQHRRLARNLDIVLLDALEPFGFGHVFPRGTLREPLSGLRRAHVVVLSRADIIPTEERKAIWARVREHAPQAIQAEAIHAPQALRAADGRQQPLAALQGQPVAAFCGVGNPAGFRHTLEICGYRVAGFREFADHHRYTPADAESLAQWAAQLGATAMVCTHKDLVKFRTANLTPIPLWAVTIGLRFLSGQEELEDRLASLPVAARPSSIGESCGQNL